jgi:hypothetical protein
LPAALVSCFNLEGVKFTGESFRQNMTIAGGKIGVLWWGVDASKLTASRDGTHWTFILSLTVAGRHTPVEIAFDLTVVRPAKALVEHGDRQPVNQSRLRWLNSRSGHDDNVTRGYKPLHLHRHATTNATTVTILGRTITVDPGTALPTSIVPPPRHK